MIVLTTMLVAVSAFQAWVSRQQPSFGTADLIIRYSAKLDAAPNVQILDLIERSQPILTSNGGPITTIALDNYLGIFHSVSDRYDDGLVPRSLVISEFGDAVSRTYKNKEIQEYLAAIRQENEEYFQGLDQLFELVQ